MVNTLELYLFLQPIQHDLQQNSHRLEYIDKVSSYLMQKCEASDAVQIQREVEEFHSVVENVASRLAALKDSYELGEVGVHSSLGGG